MSCVQSKNNRVKQFFVKEQPALTCGFVEPSTLADNNPDYIPLVEGFISDLIVTPIETNELKGSLTKSPAVAGQKYVTATGGFLLRGFDGATPYYNALMIGGGMVPTLTSEQIEVSTISGTIYAGEIIDDGAGNTATLLETIDVGDTTAQVKALVGTLTAVGATASGGETLTITLAPASYGVGYQFVSTDIQNISFRAELDGMQVKGFDGNCTLTFEMVASGLVQCNFEITAKIYDDGDIWYMKTATDTAINLPEYNPALVMDDARLSIDGYLGVVSGTFSIDLANEVSPIEDMNTAGGVKAYDIGDRAPTGSFTPLTQSRETYDYVQSYVTYSTVPLSARAGTTKGNKVLFFAPDFQRNTITPTDVNNKMARGVEGTLVGTGNDTELEIYVV